MQNQASIWYKLYGLFKLGEFMRIFICGGVDKDTNSKYLQNIDKLAEELVKNNHSIILVGAKTGAIGKMYNTVSNLGGHIDIIVPECYASDATNMTADNIIKVENLYMLQQTGLKQSDATIILPGGNGTVAEMYMCSDNVKAGFDTDPIYVFNINGYYDMVKKMHNFMVDAGTMKPSQHKYLTFCDSYKEIVNHLNNLK